jgi:hypothetical protein
MKIMRKCLAISGVVFVGSALAMFIFKKAGCRHESGVYEKVGKGIDERLKESMAALDNATSHVQSVFEHIKNLKH